MGWGWWKLEIGKKEREKGKGKGNGEREREKGNVEKGKGGEKKASFPISLDMTLTINITKHKMLPTKIHAFPPKPCMRCKAKEASLFCVQPSILSPRIYLLLFPSFPLFS